MLRFLFWLFWSDDLKLQIKRRNRFFCIDAHNGNTTEFLTVIIGPTKWGSKRWIVYCKEWNKQELITI